MAGLDPADAQRPAGSRNAGSAQSDNSNRRYGLMLFALYLLLYGGFVLLNAFAGGLMAQTPVAGLNVAVLYGLGLIAGAFMLAAFYDWLCR